VKHHLQSRVSARFPTPRTWRQCVSQVPSFFEDQPTYRLFRFDLLTPSPHTLSQAWLLSRSNSILSSTIPITLFRFWNRPRNFAVVDFFHNLGNNNSHHLRLEIFCGARRTSVRNSGWRARPREMHVIMKETGSASLLGSTARGMDGAYTWSWSRIQWSIEPKAILWPGRCCY